HDALERRFLHDHAARGGGDTLRLGLVGDVDHARAALLVEMREVAHGAMARSASTSSVVTPAQAGGQGRRSSLALGPRFRGDDVEEIEYRCLIMPLPPAPAASASPPRCRAVSSGTRRRGSGAR